MLRRPVRFATRPPRAQRILNLAFQSAARLPVEGLVDGLRAHAHSLIIRMVLADPVADLLRRPLSL